MSGNTGFWTFAIINMAAAFGVAALGVRSIRSGEVEKHRRLMLMAAVLVGVFVAAYAVKVVVLGRENLALWNRETVAVLRIHQGLILTFLVSGAFAFRYARTIRLSEPAAATAEIRRRHRIAGRVAMTGFGLALLTAAVVYGSILESAGK